MSGVRGGAEDEVRTLSFASGPVTLEIELDDGSVMGQVLGRTAGSVTMQRPGAEDVTVPTDSGGFFRFPEPVAGTVRFVVPLGEFTLTSPWISV